MRASRSRSNNPCARAGALQPGTTGARQEVVVRDETRHAADNQAGNTPRAPASPNDARAGTSPGGAVAHPCPRQYVIQPMLRRCGGSRTSDPSPSSPAPSHGSPSTARTGHDGPSRLQDPRGAIRHRDQPPKQKQNPVRHLLSLAHPPVLVVNSRTRRILAIH